MKLHLYWLTIAVFSISIAIGTGRASSAGEKDVSYWLEELQKKNIQAVIPLVKAGAKAAPGVAALINANEFTTRKYACIILGRMGPHARASLPQLVDALQHQDLKTRVAALECLRSLSFHAKETSADVAALTGHADGSVQDSAWRALKEIATDEKLLPLARKQLKARPVSADLPDAWLVWRLDPKASGQELFAPIFNSQIHVFRENGLNSLAWLAPDYPELVDEIAKLFDTKNTNLKKYVVDVLPTMGAPGRKMALKLIDAELAGGRDAIFRNNALQILARHNLDDRMLAKYLVMELDRQGNRDLYSTLYLLRRVGPLAKDAAPKLEALKKTGLNRLSILQAVLAVDPSRGPALRAEIVAAIKAPDKSGTISLAAQFLLYQIDKDKDSLKSIKDRFQGDKSGAVASKVGELGREGEVFIPDLERVLRADKVGARMAACRALWNVEKKTDRFVNVIRKALESDEEGYFGALSVVSVMGPGAKDLAPDLVRFVKTTGSESARHSALAALVVIDRPLALQLLKKWD